MISWLGKYSGLLKIQLLSMAFWLTAVVNSSTWLHAVQITISIYPLWSYLPPYVQAKPFFLNLWWRREGLITQNGSMLCSLRHAHNPNSLSTDCSAANDFEKTLTVLVRNGLCSGLFWFLMTQQQGLASRWWEREPETLAPIWLCDRLTTQHWKGNFLFISLSSFVCQVCLRLCALWNTVLF